MIISLTKKLYSSVGTLMQNMFVFILFVICLGSISGQEQSICEDQKIESSFFTLKAQGSNDCACRIKRNLNVPVSILINNFTCDSENDSWKLKIWVNGCQQNEINCKTQWPNSERVNLGRGNKDIYFHLFRFNPQSQWIHYEIETVPLGTSSSEVFEVTCGLSFTEIYKRDIQECIAIADGAISTTTLIPITSPTSHNPSSTTLTDEAQNNQEDLGINITLLAGGIAGGVVVLIIIIVVIIVVASCRKREKSTSTLSRRDLVTADEDTQSQYSYRRELPESQRNGKNIQNNSKTQNEETDKSFVQEEEKVANTSNVQVQAIKDKLYGKEKPLPGPAVYVTDSWWQEKQNSESAVTLPLKDIHPKGNRKSKMKSIGQQSHLSQITTNSDGEVPYTYFNKIVDDEFSFINNDMYSGHLGF